MVDLVTITNRALQSMGTRSRIASLSERSNEAIESMLVIESLRDELVRMAPWNFCKNFANLTYITSAPGTPENLNIAEAAWDKGIPAPPWAYEYQYPVDCLRPLWVIPQFTTGFSGGIPITTAVTGGVPSFWNGPPTRFLVSIDQFFAAVAIAVTAGGTGYAAGDIITLATPANGLGAPAKAIVGAVSGGVITEVSLINTVIDELQAGSYFISPTNPVAQGSTTGVGINATFTLTMETVKSDQRVILSNQEAATLCYNRRVTNPNVMDPLFINAWVEALAAKLAYQLSGDKGLANLKLGMANNHIIEARKADGNEGLTINDLTPDWIRLRGIQYPVSEYSPNIQFDWGPTFTPYG